MGRNIRKEVRQGINHNLEKGKKELKKLGKKKDGFLKEFKKFALRGNVIDLAVGVIIGGAFQKIVSSLVGDIAMPLIGLLTGQSDATGYFFVLRVPEGVSYAKGMTLADAQALGISTLNYGAFITTVVDFFLMAMIVFIFIKILNRATEGKKQKEKPEPKEKECPYCLSEIPVKAVRCKFCTSEVGKQTKA